MSAVIGQYRQGRALLASLPTTEHNTGDAMLVQISGDVPPETHAQLVALGWTYDAFYHGYAFPLPMEGAL